MQIIIPKLECNTIFSGDYRTKGEITGSADGRAKIGETTTKGKNGEDKMKRILILWAIGKMT